MDSVMQDIAWAVENSDDAAERAAFKFKKLLLVAAVEDPSGGGGGASAFEAVEIQVHSLFLLCYGETIAHYGDTNRRAVPTSKGYSNLPTYQPTSTSTCYQHLALLTYY